MNIDARAVPPRFHSILFRRPEDGVVHGEEPDYFGDLNLDQVLQSMTSGREEYQLAPFFYSPLHDVAAMSIGTRSCATSSSPRCSTRSQDSPGA